MSECILIVDDDPAFRALVHSVLEERGFSALEAGTGAEGLSLARSARPAFAIVDGFLPDCDGDEWARRLNEHGKGCPVGFVSAHPWPPARLERMRAESGVRFVMTKPIHPESLGDAIERALGRSPGSDPPPVPALERPAAPPAEPIARRRVTKTLDSLVRDFRARLPGRVAELASAIREAGPDAARWAEASRLAHRLRGTAGSYGFGEVSTWCAEIEDHLNAADGIPGPEIVPLLEASLAAAELHVGESIRPSSDTTIAKLAGAGLPIVLVVDDDPAFLALVSGFAAEALVEVVATASPDAALAAVRHRRPDLAIIDVHLTAGDGGAAARTLARDLRNQPNCEALPLAFISADQSPPARIAAAHAGASLTLAKPLGQDGFADAVRRLLAVRPGDPPRILLVDDDPDFGAWMEGVLRPDGMETKVCTDPTQAMDQCEQFLPDVVLIDLEMPQLYGLDLLRMIRTTPRWQTLPLLVVTSNASAESRLSAYRAGADDYLLKPVVPEELTARVESRLERARLLHELGDRDGLTGLLLRRPFLEGLRGRLGEAKRGNGRIALALLDLDHFKQINDTHGHVAGDAVLSRFGAMFRQRFRAEDLRGRWGGEEFALAMVDAPPEVAAGALDRLRDEFRQVRFVGEGGAIFQVSFSAGLASYPIDGEEPRALLETADRRLYAAKDAGRNQIVHTDD